MLHGQAQHVGFGDIEMQSWVVGVIICAQERGFGSCGGEAGELA